jgi:gluconokinase
VQPPVTLSLDIGSSSIRAALFDGNAHPISGSDVKIPYRWRSANDGSCELDADILFRLVVTALDKILESISAQVDVVAACSIWHSLLGVDESGDPTTPVMSWADTRSRAYTPSLKSDLDPCRTHQRTGATFHSSFWPAKLLWLRNESPDEFSRASKWLSIYDHVLFRLCGEYSTSISMASATGIFDQWRCCWDDELLEYLGIRVDQLSPVEEQRVSLTLSPEWAKRWPQLANARWLPAIGDGAADTIGSGATTPSSGVLMVGTSSAVRSIIHELPETLPSGLWCYRVDRQRAIIGGALSDGGGLVAQLAANLHLPVNAEEVMRERGAAAHRLLFLPFAFGERSTGYHEDATACLFGLTSAHDSVNVLQSAMEGIAYRLAEILDRVETVNPLEEIVASGGALRDSAVWTQIIADVLGRDLSIPDLTESALRGAVLLALESVGKIEIIAQEPRPTYTRLAYHPHCHELYRTARERHRSLYERLIDTDK